ncbi:MAG: family 43 glycosylhydrolase [Chitinophagaceae bacterium]
MKKALHYSLVRIFTYLLIATACSKKNNTPPPPPPPPGPGAKTFTNPLINGSDPWVYQRDTFYYYTHTLGNRVAIWKTNKMSQIANAPRTTIFSPVPGTPNSEKIWAPEIHYLDGKWYTYYTAGSGHDSTQRLWVLENSNADPTTGNWVDKGRIFAGNADFWAIDGTVLEYNNSRYFIWSGRPNQSMLNQNIYIAKMSNPWTLEGSAVMISKPDLPWETVGGPVNEGAEVLKKDNTIFLIYSASGCWTDDYKMGILTLGNGGNPLTSSDWIKNQQPVFTKQPANNSFGPGHGSFFKSRDGTEDWMIYHANTNTGEGCGERRNIRMQKFTWNASGIPVFGEPVKINIPIPVPSGE